MLDQPFYNLEHRLRAKVALAVSLVVREIALRESGAVEGKAERAR
jgi:hypothetical protein